MHGTNDIRIKNIKSLISPVTLLNQLPLTPEALNTVKQTRHAIANILRGNDPRLLVVVGPCSIHDAQAAMDYAKRLKKCIDHYHSQLCIVMRVYFEKPRTTVGWKGLINDPYLDNSFCINDGLRIARQLLLDINNLGVPTGSEFLDTTIPQYISDLTSWSAIGARTTESQMHRELASGLSMPVGFKNGTSGSTKIAIDAIYAAKHPHHFLGVDQQGHAAIISTIGNSDCHIILRGSTTGPNYDQETIDKVLTGLKEHALATKVMIDCSHGNSNKDYTQQLNVVRELTSRLTDGNQDILGVMIESNLKEGNQALTDPKTLEYGKSITDACINWHDTEFVLKQLSQAIVRNHTK